MSEYSNLAKQNMLSSIELCSNGLTKVSNELSLLQMLIEKWDRVCKIKHCDQETTGHQHALRRS